MPRRTANVEATRVWFYVWPDGRTSDYTASSAPEEDGSFSLSVKIPEHARASTWYRIAIEPKDGSPPSTATLPLMVGINAGR